MIEDKRAELQEEALIQVLTVWAQQRKIPGYQDYVSILRVWLDRITDGSPITPITLVNAQEKAEISLLINFLTGLFVDLKMYETIADDIRSELDRYRQQITEHAQAWSKLLDKLALLVEQTRRQHETNTGKAITNPFSEQLGGKYVNTHLDRVRGTLDLIPDLDAAITQSPVDISVRLYPEHNMRGGVRHNVTDEDLAIQEYRTMGIERDISADILPTVEYEGHSYRGIVAEVCFTYRTSITFNVLNVKTRGIFPLDVVALKTKNELEQPWRDLLDLDTNTGIRPEVTSTNDDNIAIRQLPYTTAKYIKIVLCQCHHESRSQAPSEVDDPYALALSANEGAVVHTQPDIPRQLYRISIKTVEFRLKQFHNQGKGIYTSPLYRLDQEPIETVRLYATTKIPRASSIEWTLVDSTQGIRVPVLPVGTQWVHESANMLGSEDILLTFPHARGTTPVVRINGKAMNTDLFPVTLVNSTQIRVQKIKPLARDRVTVDYIPAHGQAVVVYIITTTSGDAESVSGQNTSNTVYASRAAADEAILQSDKPEQLESRAMYARIDEFNYWFVGGTVEANIGRSDISIPVYKE
jgi:hypothetical protein